MTACSFGHLLYTLRVAVEAANEALRWRGAMQYQSGDEQLHVDLPHDNRVDAPLDPFVLPLSWFRDPRVPFVTEFCVEFDCRFRYERGGRRWGLKIDELVIELDPPRRRRFGWNRAHRMCVRMRTTESWAPRVLIDGRVAEKR